MRKRTRRMELIEPARSGPPSVASAVIQRSGKEDRLTVIVDTSAGSKRVRRSKRAIELAPAAASLDDLGKLLVHHLHTELREILK